VAIFYLIHKKNIVRFEIALLSLRDAEGVIGMTDFGLMFFEKLKNSRSWMCRGW
jgi:hypothetical protein